MVVRMRLGDLGGISGWKIVQGDKEGGFEA